MNDWKNADHYQPNNYDDVLVYQEYYGYVIAHKARTNQDYIPNYGWINSDTGEVMDTIMYPILYWMDLPELPSEAWKDD